MWALHRLVWWRQFSVSAGTREFRDSRAGFHHKTRQSVVRSTSMSRGLVATRPITTICHNGFMQQTRHHQPHRQALPQAWGIPTRVAGGKYYSLCGLGLHNALAQADRLGGLAVTVNFPSTTLCVSASNHWGCTRHQQGFWMEAPFSCADMCSRGVNALL